MTEGPTARAKAIRINERFRGKKLLDIFARTKRMSINPRVLIGKKLEDVDTYGKNIILFLDSYAIRIHLMMYGTIHIYKPDEPLLKPERMIRLSLTFETGRLVVYNAPIVELNRKSRIVRYLKRTLGEDPLRDDWNPEHAVQLILKHKNRKIGDVLLDQKVIAGVGNIVRNEVLFRAKIHPDRLVRDLTEEEVRQWVDYMARNARSIDVEIDEVKQWELNSLFT